MQKVVEESGAGSDDDIEKYGPKVIAQPPTLKDFLEIEGEGPLSIA